ncbi:DNA polymerase III sliding clamp (beta) subunit, PCNA homolog [Streptomyces sp. TLI_053]|uniref:DNA polymerase III subunit beta family protein n=1 Tax=Streptomyces sp. TLI_053 TaxID=1855352 RepID=UPI00087CD50E|nr:MerR family transcriptional regulator [Streptomyces sp. TLI_053]SDT73307.1 DNA polymerase III sliding clamp (beta) subunit, PCNA homolog [Streptomyces sp. TLI_053]
MESDLRSIGELARDSGLSISALRFYDGAEVLAPARVDPRTGYRWYAPGQLADARLLARLRRVGLPLADIRAVLGAVPGSGAARRVVDEHLRRLEDGLADARRELSLIRRLIDQRESLMTTTPAEYRFTVPAVGLAEALDAVRFAVGDDPGLPVLSGVLFDLDGGLLRLVATDRYRIALAEVPARPVEPAESAVPAESVESAVPAVPADFAESAAPAASAVVPVALADAVRALLGSAAGAVELALGAGTVHVTVGGHRIEGAALDHDYPDYRPLVRLEPAHRIGLPAAELRAALVSAVTSSLPSGPHGAACEVALLTVDSEGRFAVAAPGADADGSDDILRVAVNRDFLLEAVPVDAPGQLLLELGGPITPLAVRTADRPGTFSVLMPVRLPA